MSQSGTQRIIITFN